MIEHCYIHIPFCARKCKYCSFVSGFNIQDKDKYLNALFYEISCKYAYDKLKTLYIGGGTPSLLDTADIKKIIGRFNLAQDCEITLEANPETVEEEKFSQINKAGVNRISLGVQSFNNYILKAIGRNHTSSDIRKALNNIKRAGFDNISIDLMYGLPSQDFDLFAQDVQNALKTEVKHISAYGLKLDEKSFFGKNPPSDLADDDMQAKMYMYLCKILNANNFNHYEISNFSYTGYESKHNNSYWLNKNYYGFGLNASGYENNIRYKNTSDFCKYLSNPFEKEEEHLLSRQETLENEIFLALRLKTGVNIKKINSKFNIDFMTKYRTIIQKYISSGLLKYTDNKIMLTEQGFLLSNEVMADFIE